MGRATTGVAIAGLVAIAGSLLTAPTPAHASEAALDGARAAISASMSRGTYSEDVLSGKITVEQIVDVDLAARAAIHADATRIPTRAALIRDTETAQTFFSLAPAHLRELRTRHSLRAQPVLGSAMTAHLADEVRGVVGDFCPGEPARIEPGLSRRATRERELRARLIQRWLSHGLSRATATRRAESNDVPNARRVLEKELPAHLILAIQPENTLPKLPLGTHTSIGPRSTSVATT